MHNPKDKKASASFVIVKNITRNTVVAQRCVVASTFWARSIGLLNHRSLDDGEGLLIEQCSCIHMLGMRFSIDAAFLDRDGQVLRVVANLKPWVTAVGQRGAVAVLELPAGTLANSDTHVGDRFEFQPL